MKLIVDSREKRWEHIREYFDKNGIEYTIKKLDTADYMIEGKPNVAVDRKMSLAELSKNLTNVSDNRRFFRELKRAYDSNIKLFIVCEHGGKIKKLDDVTVWSDKYSGVSGYELKRRIQRIEITYPNVNFIFCNKRATARKIIEILESE